MPLILHTADWQIGRRYGGFEPDDAVPLAEARLAAVERLAALAQAERVDAVVVAGDVFDAQGVSERCIRRLFQALDGYDGPWVMIPGNHDAALAESVWTHAQRLGAVPPRVRLALAPEVVEIADARLAFLCAPLTQRHTAADMTAWFDDAATPPGWLRVGVAHGAIQGVLAESVAINNPIAPDRAARARLDYLALGDWHGTRRIDERTWYSGTPEPDRFRANDSGQALLVRIDAPGAVPAVRALRTARHRWRQDARRLSLAGDIDALAAWLADGDGSDVVDLALDGTLDVAGHTRLAEVLGRAGAQLRALRVDRGALHLAPTDDDIAALRASGYLGEVVAELREARGDDAPRAQHALALLTAWLAERAPQGSASPSPLPSPRPPSSPLPLSQTPAATVPGTTTWTHRADTTAVDPGPTATVDPGSAATADPGSAATVDPGSA